MSDSSKLIYNNLFLNSANRKNISVFISGAEQVGTSWSALSIAHALNMLNKKVLLVDGRGSLSNISSYLCLQNNNYLEDYFNGKKTLNQLIVAYKNKDFNLLSAISGNKYITQPPIGRIQLFAQDLNIISKNYDNTFIDLGTDLLEKNVSLCQIAKNIIILCSDGNDGLVKTLDTIKYLNQLGFSDNCKIIINKANSFEGGYKIYEKLGKAAERNGLKFPDLLGIIRLDARIRDTIKNKDLLLSRYPESEAAQDISEIAKGFV
ncbi:MAG: MinD/ParA family protein [Alphaproteobacteria bacterium]|nr:MinD/ParA family protein [Alphaproteobacteria bacterium]